MYIYYLYLLFYINYLIFIIILYLLFYIYSMLKNLLQQVIKKDKFTNEYIAFPTFHDLAPRAFKKIDAEDIWKLDLNDLFHHVSKFESYLDSIRDNYTQLLQRIMSHQSTCIY